MSYARHPKVPPPTPKDWPEALKDETEFLDSLIDIGYSSIRNLAVQNIHEDRHWSYIAPQSYGLVDRTEYCAAFGWLKLVDIEVPEKDTPKTNIASSKATKKKSTGGA